jgi:hypothetical protein
MGSAAVPAQGWDMKRRVFLAGLAVGLALSAPAFAEGVADGIVRQLRDQGYSTITVKQTLLGRTRILAVGPDGQREIIINPRTGEILRDFWTNSGSSSQIVRTGGSGGDDDDSDDDSDDDAEDDSDNSGSGSDDDDSSDDDSDSGGDDDDDD